MADRWELVEPAGLARVADFVEAIAASVLADPGDFPYAAQSELPARPDGAAKGERAWLGTIPDFVETVDGVQLAGVMPGSPAEETGLAKGDLVVAVAGERVSGLADLTRILHAHRPGETVDVEVVRAGERRTHRTTLRERRR
jgi:S1-C subfamily serine protease